MLRLKSQLVEAGISILDAAAACGLTRSALSQIVNNDAWPKSVPRAVTEAAIRQFLQGRGIDATDCFVVMAPDCSNSPAPVSNDGEANEGVNMILRKQRLTEQARQHFSLRRDPFAEDPAAVEDVFMTQNMREIYTDMESAALNGRFIAVCGESGAGKTTLRELLETNLASHNVKIIKPYILGMEDNDRKGKTLRVAHIEEAIIRTLDPAAAIKRTSEARDKQMHDLLKDAGCPCVLIIEEAHSLPIPTLKHFKRLRELKDGLRVLLGVLLIGQPELEDKLGTGRRDVREVVQRCELTRLQHLGSALPAYIEHRFQRAGVGSAARLFEADAFLALAQRLNDETRQVVRQGDRETTVKTRTPMLYPLLVGNAAIMAINEAARLGMPKINRDLIEEVLK